MQENRVPLTQRVSESITAALEHLSEVPESYIAVLPELKGPLAKLSEFKTAKFMVVFSAADQEAYFLAFDDMLTNVAIVATECKVSEDTIFSVDYEQFAAATTRESTVTITHSDLFIKTLRTEATVLQNEFVAAIMKRLAKILNHDPFADGSALPAELWPMVRESIKSMALEAYMSAKKDRLDLYVSQPRKGELCLASADDYHFVVTAMPTETELPSNVHLPSNSLNSMAKLFNSTGKADGELDSNLQLSQDDYGAFFVGDAALLYVPHTQENPDMYEVPTKFYYASKDAQAKARIRIPMKDMKEGFSFISAMCSSEKVPCELTVGNNRLRMAKFKKSGAKAGGSYEIEVTECDAQGSYKTRIDPRLIKEVSTLVKTSESVLISMYDEALSHLLTLETAKSKLGVTTLYMLSTQE